MKWQYSIVFGITLMVSACLESFATECSNSTQCPGSRLCQAGRCTSYATGSVQQPKLSPDTNADTEATRKSSISCNSNRSEPPNLRINEILPNVPDGQKGDANDDGTRDAVDDEFIELTNGSDGRIALSKIRLEVDGNPNQIDTPKACLNPKQTLVIFSGGNLTQIRSENSKVLYTTASGSLSLSNSGGSITLLWEGQKIDELSYGNAPAESLTLTPQHTGNEYKPHRTLSDRLFSPGMCPGGEAFTSKGCAGVK